MIDGDLGHSASEADSRPGFQRLVSEAGWTMWASRCPGWPAAAGSGISCWCATRRCVFVWRWRGATAGPSQRSGEAGGSLIRGIAGEGRSSLDNVGAGRYCQTARFRLARSEGVIRVNQWLGVSSTTFQYLSAYVWRRVAGWSRHKTRGSRGGSSAAATATADGGPGARSWRCSTPGWSPQPGTATGDR
jgi:hypothetical protein